MATAILLIRPKFFGFDPETATDNPMQRQDMSQTADEIQRLALGEFDGLVAVLRAEGVTCVVVEDTENPRKPNAVFPNNWISFHSDHTAILYPMRTPSRRVERRVDVLNTIKDELGLSFVADSSLLANEVSNKFLEGTGSIVFDYDGECAYCCQSERTNAGAICDLGDKLDGIYFHVFDAYDKSGMFIYHTNVMMCIAAKYAVICLEAIRDKGTSETIVESLQALDREVIPITLDQVECFAGNMLEVVSRSDGESKLVMSATAFASLTDAQKHKLSTYSKLVVVPVPTIEKYGGGSVRCMMCAISHTV